MKKSSRTSSLRGAVTRAAAAQAPAPATKDLRGALLSRQQRNGALSSPGFQINDTRECHYRLREREGQTPMAWHFPV